MGICVHALLEANLCVPLGIAYVGGYKLIAINMLFLKLQDHQWVIYFILFIFA